MTIKEQIAALYDEIKVLEDEAANLQVKSFELRQRREELIAQMILEEKMLDRTNWELNLNPSDSATLDYAGAITDEVIVSIRELCWAGWHSSFELSDGVSLQFDGNEVYLQFTETKQVMPFVKKSGLTISGSGVSDKLNKLKREVAALEKIAHQFNLPKVGNQ